MKCRLHLSKNKKLTGVCGGISESFGIDATVVRIIFVLLALIFRLPIIIAYLIFWAVFPTEC
jgi:phage shock protein C